MNSIEFTCRSCGSTRGALVLDLGNQPLANNLLLEEDVPKEPRFPLRLAVCGDCWLLQIVDLVPPVTLFHDYVYLSSFSDTMLEHARQAAEKYRTDYRLGPGSLVVEAGSNDGYLLQFFQRAGVPCLGIEPAANIARVAQGKGIETVVDFFGASLAARLASEGRRADLLLGNNVFAHAPDTNDFVAGLARLLRPGGRVVLEFPYGVDMLAKREFDTIYHEHVFYFTLTALLPLFRRHGLAVFRVDRISIHGGSLRLFAGHHGAHEVEASVRTLLDEEASLGVRSLAHYSQFGSQVEALRSELTKLLSELKRSGRSIAAYGASAKGSTLLNYFGLGRETLDFVADRSPYKQGRLTPGAHLPIVATHELARRRPDYTLLLTWNFAEEILSQQAAYRQAGGQFIIPIPKVRIL